MSGLAATLGAGAPPGAPGAASGGADAEAACAEVTVEGSTSRSLATCS
jgi:hypothetical protein